MAKRARPAASTPRTQSSAPNVDAWEQRAQPGSRLPAEDRRKHLLDVALEAFIAHGLAGARIRDIANTAGVNEALIYRYFDSKEALFEAAVIEPLQEMVRAIGEGAKANAHVTDPVSKYKAVRKTNQEFIELLTSMAPLLGAALFSDHGRAFYSETMYPLLEDTFKTADLMMDGWAGRPFDPSVIMVAYFGMCFGIGLDAHLRPPTAEPNHIVNEVTEFIIRGLAISNPSEAAPAPGSRGRRKRATG